MHFKIRKWRLHFTLLSMFYISYGTTTSVSPSAAVDLADLAAEHRATEDLESLYPSPEVSDSSFVWRAGQGTYRLGVQAPDHWRVENRNVDGSVWGQYFYKTPDGGQVNVQYNAGASPRSKASAHNEFLRLSEGTVGGAGQLLSPGGAGSLDGSEAQYGEYGGSPDGSEALRSLLRELQVREQVLPYGALKAASEGKIVVRAGDIVDDELKAVVTVVEDDDEAGGRSSLVNPATRT